MAEKQKLTVVVDADLMKHFRMVALQEGKTVATIVRDFMTWYVKEKG